MKNQLFIALVAVLVNFSSATVCVTQAFPTAGTDPSNGIITATTLNGHIDNTAISCTSQGVGDSYVFAKIKLPDSASSAEYANVCYSRTAGAYGSAAKLIGNFVETRTGTFTNAAGTVVSSSDFSTNGDVTSATVSYYHNVRAIWGFFQDLTAASTPNSNANWAVNFIYCYSANSATACSNGPTAVTATAAAVELDFGSVPSGAGQSGCKFTITPSAASDITITTSGTVTAPQISCAKEVSSSNFETFSITSKTDTALTNVLSIACAMPALDSN